MWAFATASAGFLLAVLWFDLMHDVAWRTDLDSVASGVTGEAMNVSPGQTMV